MKKKMLVGALVLICLSIVAFGTTAYFTYEDTATNVITFGNIVIQLQEWTVSPETGEKISAEDPTVDVLPGKEVSRIVQVANVGDEPAWIRIGVDKSIILAEGVTGEADLSLISYDLNTEYWTEQDGYFYYNTALAAGETTQPLFTKVIFASNMSNLYQSSKAVLKINAQATQVANNGETVFEAAGWPEKDAA